MIKFLILLTIIVFVKNVDPKRANVCKNLVDYITWDPRHCWYNPDMDMSVPEIIKYHGYPFEEYEAETPDGYLLSVFRMPKANPKGIMLLQHPAVAISAGWVDKGNSSFGFMLWDAGYDVWLGNYRGTTYSRRHKFLDPEQMKYWNFSFHEIGVYDIPTKINLIANITNAKPQGISLVCYSMSSAAAAVYATLLPEHSKKWLNVIVLMAPAVTVATLPSNLHNSAAPYANQLVEFTKQINMGEVIPFRNPFFRWVFHMCSNNPAMLVVCATIENLVFGIAPNEISAEYFPLKFSSAPGGASINCYLHILQIVRDHGRFQWFDWGKEKNLEYYHSEKPPRYPFENISVPIYLVHGDPDSSAARVDVEMLYKDYLPPIAKKYGKMFIQNYTHGSYFYGRDIKRILYTPLLAFIDKIYDDQKLELNN